MKHTGWIKADAADSENERVLKDELSCVVLRVLENHLGGSKKPTHKRIRYSYFPFWDTSDLRTIPWPLP